MKNINEIAFLVQSRLNSERVPRKMVKDLLVSLKQSGTTIFFNTHILADVESICDKISIIKPSIKALKKETIKVIKNIGPKK